MNEKLYSLRLKFNGIMLEDNENACIVGKVKCSLLYPRSLPVHSFNRLSAKLHAGLRWVHFFDSHFCRLLCISVQVSGNNYLVSLSRERNDDRPKVASPMPGGPQYSFLCCSAQNKSDFESEARVAYSLRWWCIEFAVVASGSGERCSIGRSDRDYGSALLCSISLQGSGKVPFSAVIPYHEDHQQMRKFLHQR